ncbi:transposase [Streptomyces antimycoticus]|uniref:transposase n=1 Tax=Streptomyces antimycoticus TaxID=68175 RepID=UPI0033E34D7F
MSWVCCSRTRTSWGRFPARGGPGLAPGTLAVVSVMQFAERLTDRQPADAVRSRIDWKHLLELELEDEGFPFSVLSGFRTAWLNTATRGSWTGCCPGCPGWISRARADVSARTPPTSWLW